jgi:allantoin racemase
MSMKICYQNIITTPEKMLKDFGLDHAAADTDESAEKVLGVARRAAREDTQIDWFDTKHSAYMINYSYLELLNNVWVVDGVIEAEKQGYDAVIIGCGNDPALKEARQAVDIPVVGPTEAAMLLACTLGYRFGLITVWGMTNVCEDNIRNKGLSWRAVSTVRNYELGEDPFKGFQDMMDNPDTINPQLDELCRALVADGAEVIIPACTRLSPAAALIGYSEVPGTGVPVIEVTQAAVKFAEMLVDLKRTVGLGKSQRNVYKSAPKEMRDQMRILAKSV